MESQLFSRTASLFAFSGALFLSLASFGAGAPPPDQIPAEHGNVTIQPLNHATFTLDWNGKKIFVDPVGGGQRFQGTPDLILVTDIHGDHLNADTLKAV